MGKLLSILGILCLLNSFSGVSAGRPPIPTKQGQDGSGNGIYDPVSCRSVPCSNMPNCSVIVCS